MSVYTQIRVTFVNEFGVEEAGIDGGGIFKDFMENITRAAFDVQYGLFKVCNYWVVIILHANFCLSHIYLHIHMHLLYKIAKAHFYDLF